MRSFSKSKQPRFKQHHVYPAAILVQTCASTLCFAFTMALSAMPNLQWFGPSWMVQSTREFNSEPLVTKPARAYQWETLDQEFGKDFLDWLQAGVATVASVSKSRCKGDNPVPSARKRKPATKRQHTRSHHRPRSDMATRRRRCARGKCVRVEEVPVCVTVKL